MPGEETVSMDKMIVVGNDIYDKYIREDGYDVDKTERIFRFSRESPEWSYLVYPPSLIWENAHHEHDWKPFRYPAGKHGSVYRQEDTGGPSRFLLGMDEPVSLSVLYVKISKALVNNQGESRQSERIARLFELMK